MFDTNEVFNSNDTFLIADCHLDGSRPEITELFTQFVGAIQGASALWIVGDLVEYWLGDDAGNPALHSAFEALSIRCSEGTEVHLMHGNRDFLLGQQFADSIGASLHTDDEVRLNLGRDEQLVMHGDTLCTDDVDYQRLRTLLRSSQWQDTFLALSVPERIEAANALRDKSRDATAEKNQTIMDVNNDAVVSCFERTTTGTLIHGHTHRPATHEHFIKGETHQRIVMGDWHDDHAMVVHHGRDGLSLRRYPFKG